MLQLILWNGQQEYTETETWVRFTESVLMTKYERIFEFETVSILLI